MSRNQSLKKGVLFSISLLGQLAIGILSLGIIFFLRTRYSLSAQLIGIYSSVGTLCYFFGCTLSSFFSFLKPRHAVQIASGGMGLSILVIAFEGPLFVSFIAYGAYGLFMSLYWPQIMGWLTRGIEGRELSGTISQFNLSWSTGIFLAPYLSGLLTQQRIVYPIYTAALLMFLILLIVLVSTRLVPEIRSSVSSKEEVSASAQVDTSTLLRYSCWILLFCAYYLFGISMNIYPIYGKEVLLLTESSIGLQLLSRGVVTTIFFVLLGTVSWWHYNRLQILLTSILLLAVSLLGLFLSTPQGFYLFYLLFGLAFALSYTNSIFHGAAGSIDRASRMAIHEAVLTSGTILGAFLGGILYARWGFSSVMLSAIIVSGVGSLGVLVVLLRVKQSGNT